MRAVIQRVTRASVAVNGGEPRPIGPGLVILLGVRDTDDIAIVPKLAEKCAHLRIFEDEDGKLNRSAVELGYSALVVSNFTLYGDTSRGKRPSFSHAAKGDLAVPCYEKFLDEMSHQGLKDVSGTSFDFRSAKTIAQDFMSDDDQRKVKGYDHAFLLQAKGDVKQPAAQVWSADEKLQMTVYTTAPALQFYSGNYLGGTTAREHDEYSDWQGLALESEFLPDSPNHPEWPQPDCVLRPGKEYVSVTEYHFIPH